MDQPFGSALERILYDPVVGRVIFVVLGVAVIITLVRLVQRAVGRYVADGENRYRLRKLVSFSGYIVAVLFLMVVFSDKLGGLTVAFGVAGAGVAFALQEVIASVAGWIAISVGGFYKTGDRVQVGGIKGDVIDIGILRTTLMEMGQWVNGDLYNGRVVRVANSFVFKEPVFNYSADFPFLWDEITVPVRYGSDYKLARSIIADAADAIVGPYTADAKAHWEAMVKKFMIENARIDPMVTMVANDNWVEFTLRYVVDHKFRRATKDKLFVRILDRIDRSKGKVALASATFEIVGAPPITVRRSGRGRSS